MVRGCKCRISPSSRRSGLCRRCAEGLAVPGARRRSGRGRWRRTEVAREAAAREVSETVRTAIPRGGRPAEAAVEAGEVQSTENWRSSTGTTAPEPTSWMSNGPARVTVTGVPPIVMLRSVTAVEVLLAKRTPGRSVSAPSSKSSGFGSPSSSKAGEDPETAPRTLRSLARLHEEPPCSNRRASPLAPGVFNEWHLNSSSARPRVQSAAARGRQGVTLDQRAVWPASKSSPKIRWTWTRASQARFTEAVVG